MQALLMGSGCYGVAALQALQRAGVTVPLVVVSSDDANGAYGPSLESVAAASGIETARSDDPHRDSALAARIASAAPEIMLCAGYGGKTSTHLFKATRVALQAHASLLPKYRGPSPSNWALINGERETGITVAKLARQPDSGDVILQRAVAIAADDDDAALRTKLCDAIISALDVVLAAVKGGAAPIAHAQSEEITFFPAVTKRDGHIRFDQSTESVRNRFRGVTPHPGAYTDYCGIEFPILALAADGGSAYDDLPGRVLFVDDAAKEIRVKTLDGTVRLRLVDELNRLGAIARLHEGQPTFAGKATPFSAASADGEAEYDVEMPTDEELSTYGEFPDMVVMAVAYPCNAHCPNCPYTPGNSDIRLKYGDASFMSPELFEKIADECGEAGRRGWLPGGVGSMLRITGGGEPMLHPHGMTNLIAYAKGVGARVYLNSNGSLFKDDDIERLLECHTDNIEISVDAGDRVTYAIVRKGLSWDHLLQTVSRLVERRNATRSLTTIEVSVINQEIVSGRIPEIERFWYDLGVDNVIVRKFLTWGSSTNIDPNTSADPLPYLDRDNAIPCPYPFHRLNVDSRGKVEVCGFDIGGRTNMGNLKQQTIREIWRGAMFEWWRTMHRSGKGGDIPLCAECPDWKYRSWRHNYRKALTNAQSRRDASWATAE
ncbi:MAG TPA: formyltransferase family protein [Candidatus Dormibacteraeota bacterium]|nr:formyltransferase family protein [Candidatus Dormibacteraeota bacterium]